MAGDKDNGHDLNRELIELLNELRVALPGVQVLFAFLLAVPFTQQWQKVTDVQKHTFFVTLMLTTLSTVLLMAPTSYHRLRWREHDKERMLRISNALTIAGTVVLALAMTGAVFLVTDVLFAATSAAAVSAACALVFLGFWYVLPLAMKLRDADGSD